MVAAPYETLGFAAAPSDSLSRRMVRSVVARIACEARLPACWTDALTAYPTEDAE